MTYSTYFEVGGHVLEHHLNRPELPGRPAATGVQGITGYQLKNARRS